MTPEDQVALNNIVSAIDRIMHRLKTRRLDQVTEVEVKYIQADKLLELVKKYQRPDLPGNQRQTFR